MKERLATKLRMLLGWGVVWSTLTGARVAAACSVCFSATDAAREAYYSTTAFMIVLPIGLVASIGVWLYRASRRADDTH
jgi:hypothetical protein